MRSWYLPPALAVNMRKGRSLFVCTQWRHHYTQPFHYQPQMLLSYGMLVKTQPRVTMLVAATRRPSDTQLSHLIPSAFRDPRYKKDPNFPLLLTRGTECLVQISLRKNSEKTATMLLQRRHSTFQFEGCQPYQKLYCAMKDMLRCAST
jgi:hypothetical protein